MTEPTAELMDELRMTNARLGGRIEELGAELAAITATEPSCASSWSRLGPRRPQRRRRWPTANVWLVPARPPCASASPTWRSAWARRKRHRPAPRTSGRR